MPNKRGAISKEEREFLEKNYKTLSSAEIAEALGRTEDTVKNWLVTLFKISPDESMTDEMVERAVITKELVKSPEYATLHDELTDDELKYFRHRYAKLMTQFHGNVAATEETQVYMLIKYEILKHRNLKETKDTVQDIERIEKMIKDTYESYEDIDRKDIPDNIKMFLANLENQLLAARTARQSKSAEYVKFTEKISLLMKDLKATRDQRIAKVDEISETLIDVMKKLEQEEFRKKAGRQMELLSMAAEKEKQRLSQLHTYSDGSISQPLLTPETILDE
jgi:hypothetical protein